MSKNPPTFWNCPGIVAKVGPDWWNRGDWWDDWWDDGSYWAGYLVKLPVSGWETSGGGDDSRKCWKWVLFRIYMNQRNFCTNYSIIHHHWITLECSCPGELHFDNHIQNTVLQLCCWNRSSHEAWSWSGCRMSKDRRTALCAKIILGKLLSVLRLGGQQLVAGPTAYAKYSPSSNASHARPAMVGHGWGWWEDLSDFGWIKTRHHFGPKIPIDSSTLRITKHLNVGK